jgi:hypothetical protein
MPRSRERIFRVAAVPDVVVIRDYAILAIVRGQPNDTKGVLHLHPFVSAPDESISLGRL